MTEKGTDPFFEERVERGWVRFEAAAGEAGVAPPAHPEVLAVLRRVWAASEFVAESCIREPALLADLLASGDLNRPYPAGAHARRLAAALRGCRDEAALARILRRERRREMVRIAWRDLAGWADLAGTLRETSWLAEAAVDTALAKLHAWAAEEHGVPHGARSGEPQGLVVLGMGKLGAFELNFSSDIDLILAYEEEGETRGRRAALDNEAFFTGVARRLVAALNEPTEDGFVFRVDLRLRPYGDSGPLVMSLAQMEEYYQRQGREWERYALIKARPVGGDRAAGERLLAMLRPFVYRRYLDYGVFESLREMKALIDREAGRRELADDIKLGRGGIREIEFIGQTFQLIRGGREPALRAQGILDVLDRLGAAGYLAPEACAELAGDYVFLRRLENRLQMYADAQTHRVPRDAAARARLARSMGFGDTDAFVRALAECRARVRGHFDQVFAQAPTPPAAPGGDAWTALWPSGDAELVTSPADDETPPAARIFGDEGIRRLRLLREGSLYRSLSANGRARMDRLMPLLLTEVAGAERPDVTLVRVLDLIEHIARRTAYLALLAETPVVLSQMVRLCAASPWIARMIGAQPLLLDELIDTRSLYRPLARDALQRELAHRLGGVAADDLEQQMEVLRQFKQAGVLRVAAADVAGAMPLMIVSDHLTEIAEVCLAEVLRLAADHTLRGGGAAARKALDRGFAIVAYGKLGGIELGYGSDLDIVFLHGGEGDETAGPIFARLGQRIIHMLSAHTPAGILYPVDLRLRPSGAAGLLVSSIAAFETYQREQAWTWEHQALVRARVVAGNGAVSKRFEALRAEILARPREPEALRGEIREMRERMRRELSRGGADRFDIKQDRGGIADIEFLVQYAVLRWAGDHPQLLRWTDNIRQLDALAEVGLIGADEAAGLKDIYRAYRARVHRLALQEIEDAVVPDDEFRDERAAVAALWDRIVGARAG